MTDYERLILENKHLTVIEADMHHFDGLIVKDTVYINKHLSNVQKYCVLAEEIEHFNISDSDITNLQDFDNLKEEVLARVMASMKLCPLHHLKYAVQKGYKAKKDIADFLGVTTEVIELVTQIYRFAQSVLD